MHAGQHAIPRIRAIEHDFVAQAAMSNMAVIQFGPLAARKAQSPDVKKFAQATIDEHLKGTTAVGPTQRLSNIKDEQFDREYMKAMVDRHPDVEKMLATRVSKRAAGSDQQSLAAKVDQWAAKALPDVRTHLQEAEQVSGALATRE